MTRLIEVKRIHVPLFPPFDYRAAKAEIEDADARGDVVEVEGQDLVIKTRVWLRGRGRAA